MSHKLSYLLVLLSSTTLFSCHRKSDCPPLRHEYFEVYSSFLWIVPYGQKDTLKFTSETGTVHQFVGAGIDSGYFVTAIQTSSDCNGNIQQHRKYYQYRFSSSTFATDLNFFVYVPVYSHGSNFYSIEIKGTTYTTILSLPPYPNSFYIDNLNIDGKTYNQVFKMIKGGLSDDPAYIYYSPFKYGIIKIIFPDKTTLTRLE